MPLSPSMKKRAVYAGAFVVIAVAVYIKHASRTDEQRDADNAGYASAANRLVGDLDQTGRINMATLAGNYFKSCKADLASSNAGSDADKQQFCGCASLGALKDYYISLPASDLRGLMSVKDPAETLPAPVTEKIYRNCNASPDYYK